MSNWVCAPEGADASCRQMPMSDSAPVIEAKKAVWPELLNCT